MRPIIFRAWDKVNEKMIDPFFRFEDFGRYFVARQDNTDYEFLPNVIMQFTGAFDIHHNMVYEGDIMYNSDRKCTSIVEYDNTLAMFISKYTSYGDEEEIFSLSDSVDNAEWVIGNIYEHPEKQIIR